MTQRQAETVLFAVGLACILLMVAGVPFVVYLVACWRMF